MTAIRAVGLPRAAAPLGAVTPTDASQAPQVVTALPATVDLAIYQGDDLYLDVTVTGADGNPADVSSTAPMSQIRVRPTDVEVTATFTVAVDGTDPSLIHLHLPASESDNVPLNAVWDLQLSVPDVTTI